MLINWIKAATWVVCPKCSEPKCKGIHNCPDIKAVLEEHKAAGRMPEAKDFIIGVDLANGPDFTSNIERTVAE